jgi:hypothetical protein
MPTTPNESFEDFLLRTSGDGLGPQMVNAPPDDHQGTFGDLNAWPDLSTPTLPLFTDGGGMYGFGGFMINDPPWNGL